MRKRFDSLQEDRRGLPEVAERKVRLRQAVRRLDLEARVLQFPRDLEGLLARLERAPMVAHVAEPGAHVGEDEPQSTSIAKLPCQDRGLPHIPQDSVVLPQGSKDDSRVEPEV